MPIAGQELGLEATLLLAWLPMQIVPHLRWSGDNCGGTARRWQTAILRPNVDQGIDEASRLMTTLPLIVDANLLLVGT